MSAAHFLSTHLWQDEAILSFHPEREDDREAHPLKGLRKFGPLSSSFLNSMMDPIRVAAIVPFGRSDWFSGILNELNHPQTPKERASYLIDYPGFSSVFRVRLVVADGLCREVPQMADQVIAESAKPHRELAELLLSEINTLRRSSAEFDILYLFLPAKWSNGFKGPREEDFDLHDFLKAECGGFDPTADPARGQSAVV